MDEKALEGIESKLDTIVRLLGRLVIASQLPDDAIQKDQIDLLSSLGLDAHQIADVVGTTLNTVQVTLSKLKQQPSSGTAP